MSQCHKVTKSQNEKRRLIASSLLGITKFFRIFVWENTKGERLDIILFHHHLATAMEVYAVAVGSRDASATHVVPGFVAIQHHVVCV